MFPNQSKSRSQERSSCWTGACCSFRALGLLRRKEDKRSQSSSVGTNAGRQRGRSGIRCFFFRSEAADREAVALRILGKRYLTKVCLRELASRAAGRREAAVQRARLRTLLLQGQRGPAFCSPDPSGHGRSSAPSGSNRRGGPSTRQVVPAMVLPRWESLEAFSLDSLDVSRLRLVTERGRGSALLCTLCRKPAGSGEAILALACGHGFCPRCFEAFLRRRWAALAAQEVPASEKEQIPCPACGVNLLRKDVHTLTGVELDKLCKRARERERGSHYGHGPVPPGSLAHLTTGSGRFTVTPVVGPLLPTTVTLPGIPGGNSCEIQRMQAQATAMATTTASSIETRSCPSPRPPAGVKTPPRLDGVLSDEAAAWAQAAVYRNMSLGCLPGASASATPPSTTAPTVTPVDPSAVAERLAAAAASAPTPLSPVSAMSESNATVGMSAVVPNSPMQPGSVAVNAWRNQSLQSPNAAAAVWGAPPPASPHSPTTVHARESSRPQLASAVPGASGSTAPATAGASASTPISGAMPQRRSVQLPTPTFGGVQGVQAVPRRISSVQHQRAGVAL